MPEHHIPRAHLHEDLRVIDHEGEQILSITPDPTDPDRYLVVTRYKGEGEHETRAVAS